MTTATNTKFYYLFFQWGYIYDHKGGDKSLAAKVLYCLTLISYPPKWVKYKCVSKCLNSSKMNNAMKIFLGGGHF